MAPIKLDTSMFCFQCEQTVGCKGCTAHAGVCGKDAETAHEQDVLTGALVDLSCAVAQTGSDAASDTALIEGLFTCVTNVDFDVKEVRHVTERVRAQTSRLLQGQAPVGFDITSVWREPDEDIRSLKSLILFGLRGMSAYAHHALVLGYTDDTLMKKFYGLLAALARDATVAELLPVALGVGEANYTCMELLDRANTQTLGSPVPTEVPLTIEPGPFIVVSGHDLSDMEQLLEQTDGLGINIYTHGEMLPAHAYPKLAEHPQLKGNFGTAWQNQRTEFDGMPAPVLFTTNCLMKPRPSYADRVYTTGVVAFPELVHIDADENGHKDFSPLIEQARALGGYAEKYVMTGINGGTHVTTGFGHDAVLSVADTVVDAVKSGAVKHIFLVGGCDGARPGRNYYTDFVRQAPKDSLILTLACGKYRFNDLDLGTIGGIPRLLDMGQCNDAYSAIVVAIALAKAFDCDVNDLPLTLVLSWYEQKAVAILLTLLQIGLKGIYLGPTLPAFLSPGVLETLVEAYDIHPTSTPEDDLAAMLSA